MLRLILFSPLTIYMIYVEATGVHKIVEQQLANFIVPEILSKPAPDICNVTYPKFTIEPATLVVMQNITTAPQVTWHCYPPAYYTLFFTDVDYDRLEDEDLPEYHVWLVYDIINCSISTGVTKFPYEIEKRPLQNGWYRHLWLVFEQPHKFTSKNGYEFQFLNRWNARIKTLIEDYDLIGPVAANFVFVAIKVLF